MPLLRRLSTGSVLSFCCFQHPFNFQVFGFNFCKSHPEVCKDGQQKKQPNKNLIKLIFKFLLLSTAWNYMQNTQKRFILAAADCTLWKCACLFHYYVERSALSPCGRVSRVISNDDQRYLFCSQSHLAFCHWCCGVFLVFPLQQIEPDAGGFKDFGFILETEAPILLSVSPHSENPTCQILKKYLFTCSCFLIFIVVQRSF